MPAITTATAYSHEFFRELILAPLYVESVVLASLRRIETTATAAYLPRVSGASVNWVPEGSEIPDSGAVVDLLPVFPRKVAALAIVSNEATGDAAADQLVGEALARALATKVDEAFFRGAGPVGPAGLPAVDGIEAVDADPAAGLDAWIDALAAIENNGGRGTAAFVSPASWAGLAKLKEATGSAKPVLADPATGPSGDMARSVAGVPVRVTPAVADGEAWLVDGSRVAAVVRLDGQVRADASARFTSDSLVLRVITRIDFGVPYAGTVARIAAAA
jgi:HK97 family phage major capsid protein